MSTFLWLFLGSDEEDGNIIRPATGISTVIMVCLIHLSQVFPCWPLKAFCSLQIFLTEEAVSDVVRALCLLYGPD